MTTSHTKTTFKSTAVRDENQRVVPYNIEEYRLNILDKFIKLLYSSACFFTYIIYRHIFGFSV